MSATIGVPRIHRGVRNGRVLISSITTSNEPWFCCDQKRRAERYDVAGVAEKELETILRARCAS